MFDSISQVQPRHQKIPQENPLELRSPKRGIDQFCCDLVMGKLASLKGGILSVTGPNGTRVIGTSDASGLEASIRVNDEKFFRFPVLAGSLGFAEAYLQGLWQTDDLVSLIRLFCRNLQGTSKLSKMYAPIARIGHYMARNSIEGSKKNIAAHYDLSNEFFQLFLDPTMMYSSAYFTTPDMSLEEASLQKLDRICQKLEIQPGDRVMEIGTGWGGWAIHAAQNYGCHVTTTTISRQQFAYASERIAEAGLHDRITLLFEDYRKLSGQYDKVVSIEMIEAVGHSFLSSYFQKCHELLKPGGKLLVQGITMPEHRYDSYRNSVDFIQKYIFPGGHLPSISEIERVIARKTRLQMISQEDFAQSYALTLREWRRRFLTQLDQVSDLGFDKRFVRMWDYYLAYCEAAFLEKVVGVSHLMWHKPAY